jgi:hypothetical protein
MQLWMSATEQCHTRPHPAPDKAEKDIRHLIRQEKIVDNSSGRIG